MAWIFIVGLAFTYAFSRLLLKIAQDRARTLRGLGEIHAASALLTAVVTWFGVSTYGVSYDPVYLLVSWFLPQTVWLSADVFKLTVRSFQEAADRKPDS
ncbi:hypothetical protein GCM10011316_26950 [Roseibium aquae]|uniref:Uncharacterized protein n=1 Tax=Roseibium aquae TaxID=1323746 RepID=A0A916X2V2_9HYPH|nr:hypothetical protein [Roseibium aquae]GGB53538.1 hypothetical protein GCM10011316_26950 [Roseibium aquae]